MLLRPARTPASDIKFAWLWVHAGAGRGAPAGTVWFEKVRVIYDEHGLGGQSYRRLDRLPKTLKSWEPSRQCAGKSLGDPEPDFYMTPPDKRVCKNLRTDGPTPCWYPHCTPGTHDDPRERNSAEFIQPR